MKKTAKQLLASAAIFFFAVVCGYLIPSGFSSSQPLNPAVATGQAHSVIYRVRESRPGQPPIEKIVLRSVNEKGEWRKETIWPKWGEAGESRLDGHYGITKEGKKLESSHGIAQGAYFQPFLESVKQTAATKEVAGLRVYLLHSENGDFVLDDAYAEETGKTPLWSRLVNRRTGLEIETEALQVIWGVKNF